MLLRPLPRARIAPFLPICRTRILPIKRHARLSRIIQTRRLLRRVVQHAKRHKPLPVRRREVETIRARPGPPQDVLLQTHDGLHGLAQGGEHGGRRVRLAFPGGRGGAVGQVRDVQGREVLGVGGAGDVGEGGGGQQGGERAADGEEVGDLE